MLCAYEITMLESYQKLACILPAGYELVPEQLGSGSYGKIYAGIERSTGHQVAVKRLYSTGDTSDTTKIVREALLMRMLAHPNIIAIKDMAMAKYRGDTIIALVLEFCQTDLFKLIKSPQILTTEHLQYFLSQMLDALAHMHSHQIIHRDIKSSNILLNRDCSLKIGDFGLSRAYYDEAGKFYRQQTSTVVTLNYRSPELLTNGHAGKMNDVWGIGCVFSELLTRTTPFFYTKGLTEIQLMRLILDLLGTPKREECQWIINQSTLDYVTQYASHSPHIMRQKFQKQSKEELELLCKFFQFDPGKRITAEAALKDPWLKDFPRHPLTISLMPETDASSKKDYYNFEDGLDAAPDKHNAPYLNKLGAQILEREIKRYANPGETLGPLLKDDIDSSLTSTKNHVQNASIASTPSTLFHHEHSEDYVKSIPSDKNRSGSTKWSCAVS